MALGIRFAVRLSGSATKTTCDYDSNDFEKINAALEGVGEWEWSIWGFNSASRGRPLQAIGWHLIHKWNLVEELKLD